jgi:hypothetical protein
VQGKNFPKTRKITNASHPKEFWRFWLQKFEFLLVFAYYDVKVLLNSNEYYSSLGSVDKAPKRKLFSLERRKKEIAETRSKMLTSLSHHDLTSCLADEKKITYTFDADIIPKVMDFWARNQATFSWNPPWKNSPAANQNALVKSNEVIRDNATEFVSKIFKSELVMNIDMKRFMEKLYQELQNCKKEDEQKFKSVPPRKIKKRKVVRFKDKKQ